MAAATHHVESGCVLNPAQEVLGRTIHTIPCKFHLSLEYNLTFSEGSPPKHFFAMAFTAAALSKRLIFWFWLCFLKLLQLQAKECYRVHFFNMSCLKLLPAEEMTTQVRATIPVTRHTLVPKGLQSRQG